ncbi:MBL fold metallo-hydrolase [Rhodopila sp.]|jgi:glyoxylase-like metal-dependent hydrolase (beta-lactamase superfamily II)|uniref:MBL fold metallo-hydrolase n=1 Tax=Rhodopila sp. TaxID=2480087 RepID=UPI002CB1032C|nr:MBL fold metallo-hydrolase [Rhodopila sp.]HVZ06289.1 MBL fold metallo-hydrolase [Rhodopila sp.]
MSLSFAVGDLTVHRVIENEGPLFDPLTFFPTLDKTVLEESRSWMQPRFLDPATGQLVLCIQSYIVRTRHHTILIDSCVGNHKERTNYPFWNQMTSDRYERNLAAHGLGFGDIDFVMCTHLHVDHVGWNTKLENGRWVPTFPKAKYVFADRELAFWTEREKTDPGKQPWITDSVLPIVSAKRHEVVRSDHELSDVVRLIPTPGHTIDHYSVRIGKPGADAIIGGDMIHSPLQARYPELPMRADYDRTQGGVSRRTLFEQICDTSTLFCSGHFPSPSTGRFTRWGDGFRFECTQA